jgi:hypothetical protein
MALDVGTDQPGRQVDRQMARSDQVTSLRMVK